MASGSGPRLQNMNRWVQTLTDSGSERFKPQKFIEIFPKTRDLVTDFSWHSWLIEASRGYDTPMGNPHPSKGFTDPGRQILQVIIHSF